MHPTLDKPMLKRFWPRASEAILNGTLTAWDAVADHYALDTIDRAAHFWGQITWECNGGTELRESGHYSEAAILATFGVGHHSATVTEAQAHSLAIMCQIDGGRTLFNRVYGLGNPHMARELGNTGPDDGWNFRGAGALNTTGRAAFARVGAAIGRDLIGNPDLANDPGISLWMGAEEYIELGCLTLADADDTHAETIRINGGTNGLAQRQALIDAWKAAFAMAAESAPAQGEALKPAATGSGSFPASLPNPQPSPMSTGHVALGATIGAGIVAAGPTMHHFLPSLTTVKETSVAIPHLILGHLLLAQVLLVVLVGLIAERLIRYYVTPGANFMSAFENDAFVVAGHALMQLGVFLGLVQAWLTAYMPLFSDSDVLTFIHAIWPGQEINAVIAGIGAIIKILTIGRTLPLPTFNAVAPAPALVVPGHSPDPAAAALTGSQAVATTGGPSGGVNGAPALVSGG